MISKILLNNNPNNFYQSQQDYEKARKNVDKKDETSSIFDIVPQVQKAEQLQNSNSASTLFANSKVLSGKVLPSSLFAPRIICV